MHTMVLWGSVDSLHGHLVVSPQVCVVRTHNDSPQGHFATIPHKATLVRVGARTGFGAEYLENG